MFIAKQPGEFFEAFINIKEDRFNDNNILCIFEINHNVTVEKHICMTALGVAAHAIKLNKYIVYLRLENGGGKFCRIVLGGQGYGITPFANFVNTIKL